MIKTASSLRQAALLVGITLAVLTFSTSCASQATVSQVAKVDAVPVTVATVIQKNVPVEVRTIGNVEAHSTVSVKAQVEGTIERAYFREGQNVRQGDLLFTLDARPFQATLHQLEANLAREEAELKNANAQADRYARLYQEGIVSKEQYDTFHTNAEALAAAVRADKAAIAKAKIDFEFCTIRALIGGRTGSLLAHPGNLVKANETVLVVINQISPIYVSFGLPEQNLAEVKRRMASGTLTVTATIPGDEARPVEGTLTFVDNMVDQATGTIRLKASFPNLDSRLWPGLFVNAAVRMASQPNAVVAPSQAVQTGMKGFYVYVVKPDLTAELRTVVTGIQVGEETVIESGLRPGETVVTDGQLRLFPGAKVELKNPQGGQAKAS